MLDAEETLRGVLEKIAIEQGYSYDNLVLEKFSTNGANYSSQLYHITLSASNKDDLRLFAKVACFSESLRAQVPFDLFDREVFYYTYLLKQYKELEEQHNLQREHRLATVKYYGSCEEYLKEVLVLEDLSHKGFQVHDRLTSYEWEYAAKSVTEMAKLHSLSVALFKEKPEQLTTLSKKLKFGVELDQMKRMMQKVTDQALNVVNKENKTKVQTFLQSFQNLDVDYYFKVRRLPVISHGDFRPSNLMHRTRENGELEIFVLDYQVLQVSNPICDLMYFIFSGSDYKFREKHYHQLLDLYYKELCNALTRLGIDAESTYPREDFDYELKEIQPFGLFMGIMVTPIVTVDSANAPDMSQSTGMEDMMVKPNDLAAVRVNELINDFIKLGVI